MIIYEDVFRSLEKGKVDYVIVGGIAANLLGLVRATADLDIMIKISLANFEKVDAILRHLGYKMRQPIDIKKINPAYLASIIKIKNLKAVSYYKPDEFNEVDIIVDSPVKFETVRRRAVVRSLKGLKLVVISIDDLIKMKTKTGRDVDKFDAAQLRKVKRMMK